MEANIKIVVNGSKACGQATGKKCVDYFFSAATTEGGELFW